ncbi:hypothetical protein E1I69_19875 [Bacillus timonensis]|uniref:Uncharacterized protein n=1 Tax=Bacillus timonensis TaxID=1033734 RepID=A0A4S3PL43_9BACI|nr:hypothetical protein [Bacillus timonensis]THE10139.1 hypothetical protein E1I69_19875 [Bacillus timonensis]
MNVKKGIVAIAIFAFLFIGAWVIHEQTKREYGENQQQFQIQTIHSTQIPEKSKVYPKFKPREYIRIER